MPKFVPVQAGPFSWLVLFALLGLIGWVLVSGIQQHPMVTSLVLIVIAIGAVVVTKQNQKRNEALRALATSRHGHSICEFAREFDPHTVDTWVIRAVYEQLQDYLEAIVPNFPIHAEDRLLGQIIDDPDDLDLDLVKEIAQRTGRSLEHAEQNPFYNQVTTVRGLVLFFNAQPKSHAT